MITWRMIDDARMPSFTTLWPTIRPRIGNRWESAFHGYRVVIKQDIRAVDLFARDVQTIHTSLNTHRSKGISVDFSKQVSRYSFSLCERGFMRACWESHLPVDIFILAMKISIYVPLIALLLVSLTQAQEESVSTEEETVSVQRWM